MGKARLILSPIEHEYTRKYGLMPDRHYERLVKDGIPVSEVGQIINSNVNSCYQDMKARHEKELGAENPFTHQTAT